MTANGMHVPAQVGRQAMHDADGQAGGFGGAYWLVLAVGVVAIALLAWSRSGKPPSRER